MFVKKIVYTVCSANHLAHCKTMADSFVKYNAEYQVIIALTDEINNTGYPYAGMYHVPAASLYHPNKQNCIAKNS